MNCTNLWHNTAEFWVIHNFFNLVKYLAQQSLTDIWNMLISIPCSDFL